MPRQERTSPRQRKLEELVALANLNNELGAPGREQQALATREHAARVSAAMQMLGLMQQQEEARQMEAFRQSQLGLDQQRMDNEMLARAGVASSEAAERGIRFAESQATADRARDLDIARINAGAASEGIRFTEQQRALDRVAEEAKGRDDRAFNLDLAKMVGGNIGDHGFSMEFLDKLLSRMSPDVYAPASAETTAGRPKPPTPEELIQQLRGAAKPTASAPPQSAPVAAPARPVADPGLRDDPRSGPIQIGPPMPENPIGATEGWLDAIMKGNITAANAHLARKYLNATSSNPNVSQSPLNDWLRLTYNLQ